MKRPLIVGLLHLVALGSLFHLGGGQLYSDPLPLPEDMQVHVNHSIDKGVVYLTRTQQPTGTWALKDKGYEVGYAAFPALTLLECGVPASDPVIQRAAFFVRNNYLKLDGTYEISLAVLFLDRLGDPRDKQLIQTLAMRLVAGQTATGGWGYKCPVPNYEQHNRLLALLRKLDPPILENLLAPPQNGLPNIIPGQGGLGNPMQGKDGKFDNPLNKGGDKSGQIIPGKETKSPGETSTGKNPKDTKDPKGMLPEMPLERVNVQTWRQPPRKYPSVGVRSGLCLKAEEAPNPDFIPKKLAQKVKPPIKVPAEFGGIPVLHPPEIVPLVELEKAPIMWGRTDNSNTQFAILALWAARRHDIPADRSLGLLLRRFTTSQEPGGGWGYAYKFGGGAGETPAMTGVGLLGLAVGHGLAKEQDGPIRDIIANDPRILNGFVALAKSIGQPTGKWNNLPMNNLYYLWALERVSVLYNLPTIGGRDWYRWSAEILVANQNQEWGNWEGPDASKGGYHGATPVLDTCFALLVLKRANLAKDLAANLPFDSARLNQQIAERLGGNIIEKKPDPPTPPIVKTPDPEPKTETPIAKLPAPKTPQVVTPPVTPPTSTPQPAANDSSEGSGIPWWVWLILALVVLAVAGGTTWYFLSHQEAEEEDEEDRPRKRKARADDFDDEEDHPRSKRRVRHRD